MPRTVLLRRQPAIRSRTLVRGAVATPEKAWVDLLRETRRSEMPFDYGELGRMLQAMGNQQINTRTLAAMRDASATQTGCWQPPESDLPTDQHRSKIAAGYAS